MFLHPHILWFLVLPLLLFVWQVRGASTQTRTKRLSSAILRLLTLSLVICALARPFQKSPDEDRQVVAIIDCSPSMDTAAIEQATAGLRKLAERVGQDSLSLVIFDSSAREFSLKEGLPTAAELVDQRSMEPGSDVAEALSLAAALCPHDGQGEIHFFGDGRETHGDTLAAAAGLGRRGISLVTHEMGATDPASALLLGLQAPSAAAVGESITLEAAIESRDALDALTQVTDDSGEVVAARRVSLQPGMNTVSFQVRPKEGGLRHYDVSIEGNDRIVSATVQVERTIVGVVESAPDAPATAVLRSLLGSQAEIRPMTTADLTQAGLETIDVLALADTPAAKLPMATQSLVRTWVENGGGLLVTGGRNAFGPGGYAKSELASMLPLRFPQKKEARDPSSALAVIIDTSGSMGMEGVNLAKEVARLALKRLKPHDKAGIVEFHGAKRWAAPMQSAANSIAIQRALNRLSAGGGTVMLPALEEAHYGLLNVRARTKHVLVLTDGGVEQGTFETLLRRMADDGIQVSTVLVGPRSGSGFLAQLASWGRGQFYTAPSRFQLPEVIVKQPSSSLLDPFVETESTLEPVLASRLTQDIPLKDAPRLRGYVKTEVKDSTELLLRSSLGDPVLARWHYGLGRVAVLTTALGGDWAREFLNWPPAPKLIANLTRQLVGVSPRESLRLTINQSSAGLDLDIRALSPEPALVATALRVVLKDDNEKLLAERTVSPVRAQTWFSRFEDPPTGDCVVEVTDASGKNVLASGGVFIPSPQEFTRAAPDSEKLAAAARTATEFAARAIASPKPLQTRELWPWCAALGLVCFVLMILARRWPTRSA